MDAGLVPWAATGRTDLSQRMLWGRRYSGDTPCSLLLPGPSQDLGTICFPQARLIGR